MWKKIINWFDDPYHRKKNGSPYDRGSADSYYLRNFINGLAQPHCFVDAKGNYSMVNSIRLDENEMTRFQIKEYYKGFNDNEKSELKKIYCEDYYEKNYYR
tara:strand:+ start:174 stop:476 length:303 start_codon:yes stop_codon:yes gene_type:complete